MSSTTDSRLATRILIGLVLGAAIGIALNLAFAPAPGAAAGESYRACLWFADTIANPIGQVFLRLLFMVVVPLVFCSLVLGVAQLGGSNNLGRIGVRAMTWFIGTTALAATLGLTLVNAFRPGDRMPDDKVAELTAQFQTDAARRVEQAQASTGFSVDTFVNMIPKNVVRAAATDSETLGVILFALLVGLAASRMPEVRTRTFLDVLKTLYEICVTILGYAMKLAPFGVAGLIFSVALKLGMPVLAALGSYLAVALSGLLLHLFVVLGALVAIFVGMSPVRFFARCRGLMITAFSTSSSNATLPTSLKTAIDEFGVPEPIAGFVLPLGATMNMNGTALFEGVAVLFLAQVAGVDLSLAQQIIVVALSVMTAIGAAGVPGGSLPLITIVLAQVGVEPGMLALILGVDRLVDMTRTVPNVLSDLVCSLWIAKKEGATLRTG